MTSPRCKEKKHEPQTVLCGNYVFYKDTKGTVWQIIKTAYKEIPVAVVNWPEKFGGKPRGKR